MTINQEFCNISHISRSLRYDEFTMKLAEGEKFVCRFSKNISGLFQQNLTFLTNKHCLNPILKNSNEKAMISLQNRVFGRRKKLAIYILNTFFLLFLLNLTPGDPRNLCAKRGSIIISGFKKVVWPKYFKRHKCVFLQRRNAGKFLLKTAMQATNH